MNRSSRAIIVGGGVIGLSTAYHLAKKKFGTIIVLDKNTVGDGSSSRAAGIVTGLLWSELGVEARKISLNLFKELSDELDGYSFNDVGCLNLFDAASWVEREKLLVLYDRLNFKYEILSSQTINERWPDLKANEESIGLFDPLGGYSEAHEYIPALKQRCLELGVEFRENCQVTAFQESKGTIAGVKTLSQDEIAADVVICSTHAWTLKLLESLNFQIPMKAFVHQRYVTNKMATPINIPAVNANPQGGYIRPARVGAVNNRLLAGFETEGREEFNVPSLDFRLPSLKTPKDVRLQMTANLSSLVPSLANATWDSEKLGLISFSLDGEPILGAIDGLKGLFVSGAFHSGGFAYNPVAGQLMAELVSTGEASLDISPFSPNRFDKTESSHYLSSTVKQAFAVKRRH